MDYIAGSYRPRVLSIIDRVWGDRRFRFHGRYWNGITESTSYVNNIDSRGLGNAVFEEIGMIKIQNLNLKIKRSVENER